MLPKPKHKQNRIGFTLIELLVAIAVLGVLSTLAVVNFSGSQVKAKNAHLESDLKQYSILLETYANTHNNLYPALGGVVDHPISDLCSALGMTKCFDDPYLTSSKSWPYYYDSDLAGTRYVLHAHLYNDGRHYFVCSNGLSGEPTVAATDPVDGICPLP